MIKRTLNGIITAWKGLSLTLKQFFTSNSRRSVIPITDDNYFKQLNSTATIQYPHQKMAVPEVGRYQLDVEIDDCIVCDLCAKICPVDCITIESIKSTEGSIGETSDGSKKLLYAAQFDIDMAKCMYCGLCTIVCPTECIIMTNQYDRTVFELSNLTYEFSDMAPEVAAEKRALLEKQQAEKAAAKAAAIKAKEGGA
jgi:NADH-quinone oxidoreductase subunit I